MYRGKGLGFAMALLVLGGYQFATIAKATAQETTDEKPAERLESGKTLSYEHGRNIYGSHGVIGQLPPRHQNRVPTVSYHRHRYYLSRHRWVAGGYYRRRYYPQRYGSVRHYHRPYIRVYRAAPVPVRAYTYYYPRYYGHRSYPPYPVTAPMAVTGAVASSNPLTSVFGTPTDWNSRCVNGRVCTGGYYRGGVPICRTWAACN